ncbi:hypothetical protein TNCV_299471 [Trichonephila clavipes]|nr:hypothetical protein TNCV_299471 [Trichonephila clavipes]
MTAQRYVHNIHQPHVLPLMAGLPEALFQQDNAWPNTAKISSGSCQEVYSDDVQELLDSHNQEMAIEEHEALDPVQSEDQMTVENLTEGFSLIEQV